jgi:hypothetical protein
MNIPTPWTGGTIYVNAVDFSAPFPFNPYIIRFEPWLNADGSVTPFETKGWQTFTFPFTAFRSNPANALYGTGIQASSLTDILGATGNKNANIWFMNERGTPVPGSGAVPAFNGAFDNIRVVRIK